MNTGKTVKRLRTEKGLTQADLAYKIGVHHTTISAIERCKTKFGALTLIKICRALRIEFHEFIFMASTKSDFYSRSSAKFRRVNLSQRKAAILRKVV